MKRLILCAAAIVSGCSPTPHHFQVNIENAGSPVASAGVSLCGGPEKALQRSGTTFAGTVALNCEGSGYVRVRTVQGITIDCPIGYVTSLEDRWNFVVRSGSCANTMKAAG